MMHEGVERETYFQWLSQAADVSQKPRRRARQRDEAAMAHGRDEIWPALKKGGKPKDKRSSS
jgi:hypothetical protein